MYMHEGMYVCIYSKYTNREWGEVVLIQCGASVASGGPALDQHSANVLCLLGSNIKVTGPG